MAKSTKEETIARFFKKVKKTNDCWIWIGALNDKGYGNFYAHWFTPKYVSAHKFSYIIHKGPVMRGLYILHSCDNPKCVNPDHLRAGTQKENQEEMVRRGRSCRGTRHGASKLTKEQVLQIIKMDGSQSQIAKVFGITQSYVSELKLGKKWSYLRATK